jgi:hypothetical protein
MPELKASLTVSTPHATSIPSLTDKKQWALPVCFDKLFAHVKAYDDTLPVITALRLCNRFGKGANCYIHKLPTELVGTIEQYIVEPEREKGLAICLRDLKCYSKECDFADDHLSPEEQDVWNWRSGLSERPARFNERQDDLLSKFSDYEDGALCSYNRQEFKSRLFVGGESTHLRTDFGVSTFITPACFDGDQWTGLAYLTLPINPWILEEEWPESDPDLNSTTNDNGYGIPLHIGAPPSPESLWRFPRALKGLDLEVFVHHSQKRAKTLSPNDRMLKESNAAGEAADGVTEKAEAWPQLTLLVQADPEVSDY